MSIKIKRNSKKANNVVNKNLSSKRMEYKILKKNKHNNNIITLDQFNKNKKKDIKIIPKSISQESYLLALESSKPIVIAVGPAGTGKTLLATLWAIKEYQKGKYNKIIISRPNVAVDDKDIGFLPGDIFKKMLPWMLPVLDIFKEYYSKQEIEMMLKEEILEICPIAYIRGRTFKNSVVILDEAQGTTPNSMLSILTRIGENSKMIITGDLRQADKIGENGLMNFMNKIKNKKNLENISLIEFSEKDIERHPAVKEILDIYQNF